MSHFIRLIRASIFVTAALTAGACGGRQAPPDAPPASEPAPPTSALPSEGAPARPAVTAQACEAGGGRVVGDIGDGAIHRPEYRCANGALPTGSIRADAGGPIAIEGSVCCPK